MMVNDVSRAFVHVNVTRDVYVQLPNEGRGPGEEDMMEIHVLDVWDERCRPKLASRVVLTFSRQWFQTGLRIAMRLRPPRKKIRT